MDTVSILRILEEQGPTRPEEIATRLNLTPEEVAAHLRDLEENHVILGHRTLIDWDKVHVERIFAFIEVDATPQHGRGFDKLGEHIANFEEVHAVHLVSGTHDLNVVVHGESLGQIAHFVSERLAPMEGVNRTATSFILKSYKIEDMIVHDQPDRRLAVSP